MPASLCWECLSRDGVVVVCFVPDPCRRCGRVPVPGALTPREIRLCLAGRKDGTP